MSERLPMTLLHERREQKIKSFLRDLFLRLSGPYRKEKNEGKSHFCAIAKKKWWERTNEREAIFVGLTPFRFSFPGSEMKFSVEMLCMTHSLAEYYTRLLNSANAFFSLLVPKACFSSSRFNARKCVAWSPYGNVHKCQRVSYQIVRSRLWERGITLNWLLKDKINISTVRSISTKNLFAFFISQISHISRP